MYIYNTTLYNALRTFVWNFYLFFFFFVSLNFIVSVTSRYTWSRSVSSPVLTVCAYTPFTTASTNSLTILCLQTIQCSVDNHFTVKSSQNIHKRVCCVYYNNYLNIQNTWRVDLITATFIKVYRVSRPRCDMKRNTANVVKRRYTDCTHIHFHLDIFIFDVIIIMTDKLYRRIACEKPYYEATQQWIYVFFFSPFHCDCSRVIQFYCVANVITIQLLLFGARYNNASQYIFPINSSQCPIKEYNALASIAIDCIRIL